MIVGLNTAAVCVRQDHHRALVAIGGHIEEVKEAMARDNVGPRDMVALDIFLPMPMMTATDIGWPA
jgi:hypothetical protein